MNEPSIFDGPEGTMAKDAIHGLNSDGKTKVLSKDVKNVYGHYMMKATYEGARQVNGRQRPFILTRSAFFGS